MPTSSETRLALQYEDYIEPYICSWHREHPELDYSGCNCHSGFWMTRAGSGKSAVDKALKLFQSEDKSFESEGNGNEDQ